jgi:tetratricopeptide (TPR) repeat protein
VKCPHCGYARVSKKARFCPNCGNAIGAPPEPATQIRATTEVGRVEGGHVTGVEISQPTGPLTVESVVNQVEQKVVQGDYEDRRSIVNNVLVLGDAQALNAILKKLMDLQGVDERALKDLGALTVPEHVGKQIGELMAAEKEVAAQGIPATPETSYRLGMLAAYQRDYEAALDYFRQATQANPEFSDAFAAIAWLQQSQANMDLYRGDMDAAVHRLAEARTAAMHTDPLDPQALAQRGFIANTLAQLAERRREPGRTRYYEEAARLFEHAGELDPTNASAQNGLGNVQHALGNLDAAIAAYTRAIELDPDYTAAYHDLALAYEDKMAQGREWCEKALTAWRKAYALAPGDAAFPADYVLTIGQRISWLEQQCR